MTPFEIKGAIEQKLTLEWDEVLEKEYVPFIINRAFSFNMHTVFHANEMNKCSFIPKKWHYDFYFASVPKGKKFDKWIKQEKASADIQAIARYFHINNERASEFYRILTPEQMKIIHEKLYEGGRK